MFLFRLGRCTATSRKNDPRMSLSRPSHISGCPSSLLFSLFIRECHGEWFAQDWLHRHSVCEPFLWGPWPWRKGPLSGVNPPENNHHAPHKSAPNSAYPGAFGPLSPGPDCRVVVSDAPRQTPPCLQRTTLLQWAMPNRALHGLENDFAPQHCAAPSSAAINRTQRGSSSKAALSDRAPGRLTVC